MSPKNDDDICFQYAITVTLKSDSHLPKKKFFLFASMKALDDEI